MALSELTTLASTIKAMSEIVGAAIVLRDEEKLRAKVAELNALVLSAGAHAIAAQAAHLSVETKYRELRDKLAEFETWSCEKTRYALKDFGSGTFARELIPEHANGEPTHLLCVNCFDQERKSLLQFQYATEAGRKVYNCDRCNSNITLGSPPSFDVPIRGLSW